VNVARIKLAWWRTQIAAIYDIAPADAAPAARHPVALALAPVAATFRLPRERLLEIVDGMEMDLTQRRYADFAALQIYCHRVAGVVGLLSAEIFGYSDAATLDYAANLGTAFQLTNIIRDVGEDARRDRVYLPLDELARYGVAVADIMHARESAEFRRLMEYQIERALDYYARAYALLPRADRKAQRPGLVMAAIYHTLLDEIRRDGLKVLTQRTSLTPLRKLWIAWKTWIRG
jgi:phytoene synthase